MATSIVKCISLAILFLVISPKLLIKSQQVPCYFPFGDSLSDNGNNNNLFTTAKANYIPYGIDFVDGPTGRFTNGMNIPDFIARSIGFSTSVPPFALARGTKEILRGVNYASGSAGILEETSLQVGQRYTMNQQLKNHQEIVNQFGNFLGNQTTANNLLQECLYTVFIGNNDYILNYYYLPVTLSNTLYTPEEFADKLIQQYSQQLKTLYNLHARKVAVLGVLPVGCIPTVVTLFPTKASPCVEFVNNAIQLFNNKVISLINDMNTNLPGAKFTYINVTNVLTEDLTTTIGIKVPRKPCCQIFGQLVASCVPNGKVCSNRDEYSYLDSVHPTQIVANYTASRAYIAQSALDATPVDIRTLIQPTNVVLDEYSFSSSSFSF